MGSVAHSQEKRSHVQQAKGGVNWAGWPLDDPTPHRSASLCISSANGNEAR